MTGITLVYLSNRKIPLIEWFCDSLNRQWINGIPIQIIYVDFWKNSRPQAEWNNSNDPINSFIHVAPLPSAVNGEHRLTTKDYFSAANARNTGIVYAEHDYIMYIDDLSVLSPTWFGGVIEAAQEGYILEGAYRKDKKMIVDDGILISSEPDGTDSRWNLCGEGLQQGQPTWLYGCSVGMPVETLLELNGWDTIGDCIGYEDCCLGLQLEKTNSFFAYDKRVLTIESSEHHFIEGNSFCRIDPETTEEKYFELLSKYVVEKTTYKNIDPFDASHAIIDITKQSPLGAIGNKFDLRELKEKVKRGEEITVDDMKFPTHFWFDEKPFTEM